MEKVQLKVEGMHCANCALTINKYLQKKGAANITVNPIDGDVSFEIIEGNGKQQLAQGIESLGYKVQSAEKIKNKKSLLSFLADDIHRFWFCLPFTLLLMLHMFGVHIHWLMNPWIQLALALPVYIAGMMFFGKSGFKSLINRMPNMDVLVTIGSSAAFIYSLIGTIFNLGAGYMYYETTATIITLV